MVLYCMHNIYLSYFQPMNFAFEEKIHPNRSFSSDSEQKMLRKSHRLIDYRVKNDSAGTTWRCIRFGAQSDSVHMGRYSSA